MANSQIDLDRFAQAKSFTFGSTLSTGTANVVIEKGTSSASTTVLTSKGSVAIEGDLILTGNLNITGSIDEQSITNLAVKDKNITLNKGGTTGGATGSGFYIEGTSSAVIGAILFDNALASKYTIGDGTTQREIVDVSSSQTITNKTIAIASNTISGVFGVANGGTGQSSLTANALIVGNGTSPVSFIAPGTSGNILTSDGTNWVSQAPATVKKFRRTSIASGTQNGSNTTFTITNALDVGTELILIGSVPLIEGSGNNYTISGTTLTFNAGNPPLATDIITIYGNY